MLSITKTNKVAIEIEFGHLQKVISWCELNCIGNWAFYPSLEAGKEAGNYFFYFEDEYDYINFLLFKK